MRQIFFYTFSFWKICVINTGCSRVSRKLGGWSAHTRSIRWCMSEFTWCGSELGKQRVASCYHGWGSFWVHVRALLKHKLKRHIQDFIIGIFCKKKKKRAENETTQVSPFWTRATGGCMKSLKGPRASFRAELTSNEVHVMHSTSVGYRPITWAHVLSSTEGGTQKNDRTKEGEGRERRRTI